MSRTMIVWVLMLAKLTLGQVSVEENVEDEGQRCFKVTTPSATYWYQREGMGFSSIVDRDGRDWISYQPGGGAAGEYRGIPNMGWEFHPGYTRAGTSWITEQSTGHACIASRSSDGAWQCRWDFYPTHATMTVEKHGAPYWFLYEGTPGGGPDIEPATDWWMTSNGVKKPCAARQEQDIAGPEWICFGDAELSRTLLLVHHEDDTLPDEFYQMQKRMTVFGFGRSGMTACMDSVTMHFSVALYESTHYPSIRRFADSLLTSGPETPNLVIASQTFVRGNVIAAADACLLLDLQGRRVSGQWDGMEETMTARRAAGIYLVPPATSRNSEASRLVFRE